jgi:hypothetical protein
MSYTIIYEKILKWRSTSRVGECNTSTSIWRIRLVTIIYLKLEYRLISVIK